MIFNNFKPRLYQEKIFSSCLNENCLVVLPTGLGKTAIAMMVACARIKKYPKTKVLILAPTRPLVNQHYESFLKDISRDFLHEEEYVVFTGAIPATKRAELWKDARVIFSTPQGVENDIISERIDLSEVSLIVFDEAHRAAGDYSYVWIADRYRKKAKNERILALTASPGSNQEAIQEIRNNLFIDKIEYRDRESRDVVEYVKDIDFKWVEVSLPKEFEEILRLLKEINDHFLNQIKGIIQQINKKTTHISKTDILKIQGQLQGMIARGEHETETYKAISNTASLLKIQHAIELLETQGVESATIYLEDIWNQGKNEKTKAAKNLAEDSRFRTALTLIWKLKDQGIEHPKIKKTKEIVSKFLEKNENAKIIIFNNYRDSIKILDKSLKEINKKDPSGKNLLRPAIFVGQAKKKGTGITQKIQLKRIEEFKEGIHNIMLMSSVGEEGLDIPAVDLVLFYEPVPSAIRQIQRAGRTGRQETGEVIILIAKNTRDVAYRWSTIAKQKKMYELINKSNTMVEDNQKNIQTTLDKSIEENQTIIVDSREKSNRIVKDLIDMGYKIKVEMLNTADYILSENTGIEFKTKKDFVDSIIDKRIFDQASTLSRSFSKPLFIVQGEEDIYSLRNIHPNAILGTITSISIDFRTPIIFTNNTEETIKVFTNILNKQTNCMKEYTQHQIKPKGDDEIKEYFIESLPGVGPNLAKNLLTHFKTIKNLLNSSETDLTKIEKLGEIKASKIYNIFNSKYPK